MGCLGGDLAQISKKQSEFFRQELTKYCIMYKGEYLENHDQRKGMVNNDKGM